MKLCADTWFFIEVVNGNKKASKILYEVEEGKHKLYVSVVALTELLTILYQKGKSQLADNIYAYMLSTNNLYVVPITHDMCVKIAKIKHSFGLSLSDATMLATYKISGSDIFIAKDSDYASAVKQKYVNIKTPQEIL